MIEPSPSFQLATKCAFIAGLLGGVQGFLYPGLLAPIVGVERPVIQLSIRLCSEVGKRTHTRRGE